VGLVVVHAGAIARLSLAAAGAVALRSADHLPALYLSLAGRRDAGRVLAVDKAILLDAADRHLDHLVGALGDDRLFGHDVGDVLANRLPHLLAMPQPVRGAAIRTQGIRRGPAAASPEGAAGDSREHR